MAGEFQNLGDALKVVYPTKALEPMINEEAPFREKLSKSVPSNAKISEGDLKFNGVLALPQNVAQIVDGGDLQTAAERSEVQFNLRPTIFQATMNIGWLTRKVANSNKSAFNGGEVRRRTEETVSNLGKFIESTYAGTGGDGVRGTVESASASGIVLKYPVGTKLLRQGMKISAYTGGTVVTGLDAVRIASVDSLNRLITTAGTDANASLDDVIYVVPQADAVFGAIISGGTVFANGLRGLVDDGTINTDIHGLDRTTVGYERLKSYVNSNGGSLRDLTEQLLIRTCHQVRDDVGKRLTDMWTGPGQLEKYIAFVAPDRRRAVEGGTYDKSTGYKDGELVHYAPNVKLMLNSSFDIVPRELFLLSWDTWFHYLAQEMQWIDEDSMLHLAISSAGTGRAARWEAFMASFENIGCDMPSANAVIRDLKDPAIGDT